MRILLAPAETKISGGDKSHFCKENFSFESLFEKREEIFYRYEKHVQSLDIEDLKKWFGLKNEEEVLKYKVSLKDKPAMKAINRYTGVAFDALDYSSLDKKAQDFIDENVIIFSNLFGPIKAKDLIPDYKYKQGAKLPGINVEKFYKDNFSSQLDDFLGDEVIDLRAGFYEKFYKISAPVLTFKFLKDGKVVSHWAKFYRGKLLQTIAQNNIQSFAEFLNYDIDGLKLLEIHEKKNIKELILEICE